MVTTEGSGSGTVARTGRRVVIAVRKRAIGWWLPVAILLAVNPGEAAEHEKVFAGAYHTVVLKRSGTVWAWGRRLPGWAPSQVKGPGDQGYLADIADVSAGAWHTVALKPDGTVWAWGRNADAQLGNGTTTDSAAPVQVKGAGGQGYLDDVTAVAAGGAHTAVIRKDGSVWAWGRNSYGQLGNAATTDSLAPVQVKAAGGEGYLTDVTVVAAGFHYTLAMTANGSVWAWGRNRNGQLGSGTTADSAVPVRVRGAGGQGYLADVTAIAPGWDHTIALKKDGTVWAWGMSWNGLLGNGQETDSTVPVQVKGTEGEEYLTDVVAISANWRHSLALKKDGTVWAWGRNQEGQLGNGTMVPAAWKFDPDLSLYEYTPVQVRGVGGEDYLTGIAGIAAAAGHNVAVKTDGTVFVWGSNNNDQLGLGRRGYPMMRSNPAQMPGLNLHE